MIAISATMSAPLKEGDAHHPDVRETYEAPAAAPELVANLRLALTDLPHVREAYLVGRRIAIEGRPEKRQLGIAAHVGGLWGSRKHIAAFRSALEPFLPPPETAPLSWGSFGNSPVSDEIRAIGIPVSGDRVT